MIKHPLSTNGDRVIFTGVAPRNTASKGKKSSPTGPANGAERPVDAFTNKIVPFRFSGKDMVFRLSHGLFSSFDIDEGTRLLLKSIAQRVDLDGVGTLLDAGCGIGVIGVSICCRAPHVQALLQDRDALAAAFARENAAANGAAGIEVECGLAFAAMGDRRYDLVAFNMPAKAGEPVLRSFFRDIGSVLSPRGVAAVVIVAPLAGFALDACQGREIIYREQTREYLVLHFRGGDVAQGPVPAPVGMLQPYLRTRRVFSHEETSWEIDTAWSLPDFDTLGYGLQASLDIAAEAAIGGETLFWNPGQGHMPLSILAMKGSAAASIHLAARDSLELAITDFNLRQAGRPPASKTASAFEAELAKAVPAKSIDFFCAAPHPIPRVPWQGQLADSAGALLRQGGRLLLASTSTEVHRFLAGLRGFQLLESRKLFGCRAVLLKRL
jgi:hypothetical protein